MKYFKLTDLLGLTFDDRKTWITVNHKKLVVCKKLVATLSPYDLNKIDKIDQLIPYESRENVLISPKEEFWGHCSNLQVWVESKYDPNLIHTQLGLQVLYHLIREGDKLALLRFKELMHKRYKYVVKDKFVREATKVFGVWDFINSFYYNNRDLKAKLRKLKRKRFKKWQLLKYPQETLDKWL